MMSTATKRMRAVLVTTQRNYARWGDRDRAARAVHERHDRLCAKITDPVLPQVEANLASHVD